MPVPFQPPPINLGPPPWPTELLERAVFTNFSAVQDELRQHPGRDIEDRLISLVSVLRLFNKSADAILNLVERFHTEAHTKGLFRRTRRREKEAIEQDLQEQLYIFAASSMTLVDQTRALTGKVSIPGYAERIASSFAKNPRHRFVQELRVDMVHLALHEPNWRLTLGRDAGRTTSFLIHSWQLRRANEFNAEARQLLAENPDGIDLVDLVSTYRAEVASLHAWLRDAVETSAREALADYRRSQRIVRAVGSRTWWRLILSQVVIQANRDPYDYLDQYLTVEELEEVRRLPHRSKPQVDRIIELIDEDGACNTELRNLVYEAFRIEGP